MLTLSWQGTLSCNYQSIDLFYKFTIEHTFQYISDQIKTQKFLIQLQFFPGLFSTIIINNMILKLECSFFKNMKINILSATIV